jgi:DNA polymerase-1
MRADAIGLFWEDVEVTASGKRNVVRVMPEIPPTTWEPLRDLPNLERASVITVDVETKDISMEAGHGPGWARKGGGHIAGIAVGADDDGRWYFPMRHSIEPETNYEPERILGWAREQFGRKEQPKVGANLTYDLGWLRQEGVTVRGDLYDVQFAEALLDSDALVALEVLGHKYIGEGKDSFILYQWLSDFYGGKVGPTQRANIHRAPPRLVADYAVGDITLPRQVMEKQWPILHREGLWNIFRMECELIPLLIEMRFAGVTVDIKEAERVRDLLQEREKAAAKELNSLAGFEVNHDASASLAKLFDKLGLTYPRTAPSKAHPTGQPSFTKEFLNKQTHPVGGLIRKTRQYAKTRGTFVEGYILNAHIDNRIFPSIHSLKGDENGTVTGRFAMSNPNGQNLPSRDEELGPLVRGIFVPDPGHKQWRKFDWSQLQYRFLAHYAVGPGSDELRHLFNTDPRTDYHTAVQQLIKRITGIELPRKPVKNINFGFVFGMGIDKLAVTLNLPLEEATRLAETYHLGVPYVKDTLKAASEEARNWGVITTWMGRKTRFNLWSPKKWGDDRPALAYEAAVRAYGNVQRAYVHKGLNYKLQGGEGDLMKFCMLRAYKEGVFDVTGVPRLTVHDELDFSDTGEPGTAEAFDYLSHIMESSHTFRVPISVGCDVGPTWGACL